MPARLSWLLPAIAIVTSVIFFSLAYDEANSVRDLDPCAVARASGWTIATFAALAVGLLSAVVLVALAARHQRRVETAMGLVVAVGAFALAAILWAFAAGGYGWGC